MRYAMSSHVEEAENEDGAYHEGRLLLLWGQGPKNKSVEGFWRALNMGNTTSGIPKNKRQCSEDAGSRNMRDNIGSAPCSKGVN